MLLPDTRVNNVFVCWYRVSVVRAGPSVLLALWKVNISMLQELWCLSLSKTLWTAPVCVGG